VRASSGLTGGVEAALGDTAQECEHSCGVSPSEVRKGNAIESEHQHAKTGEAVSPRPKVEVNHPATGALRHRTETKPGAGHLLPPTTKPGG
jgi:hypothetical protein